MQPRPARADGSLVPAENMPATTRYAAQSAWRAMPLCGGRHSITPRLSKRHRATAHPFRPSSDTRVVDNVHTRIQARAGMGRSVIRSDPWRCR